MENNREIESGSQSSQMTEQAKQQTQQKASQVAEQTRQQAKSRLATQKDQAAERLSPIEVALQETGQQLRDQGQDSVAQHAERAAEYIERFSGHLRESDVDGLIGEAEDFARSKPALFLGGAAALGFFGTRFLKSSSEEAGSTGRH